MVIAGSILVLEVIFNCSKCYSAVKGGLFSLLFGWLVVVFFLVTGSSAKSFSYLFSFCEYKDFLKIIK